MSDKVCHLAVFKLTYREVKQHKAAPFDEIRRNDAKTTQKWQASRKTSKSFAVLRGMNSGRALVARLERSCKGPDMPTQGDSLK